MGTPKVYTMFKQNRLHRINSERFIPPSLPIEVWNLPTVVERAEESFAVIMSDRRILKLNQTCSRFSFLFLFRFAFTRPELCWKCPILYWGSGLCYQCAGHMIFRPKIQPNELEREYRYDVVRK